MNEPHFLGASRALEQREADFQSCFSPLPVGKRRAILGDGGDELRNIAMDGRSTIAGDLAASGFVIDEHAVGRLPEDAAFAGDDGEAVEGLVTVRRGCGFAPPIARSLIVTLTASSPMSPPGKKIGVITYESVVNAIRESPRVRIA